MRRVLHVVRAGARAEAAGERDWLVDLATMELAAHGSPPHPPGPLSHETLVELVLAADLVITW